ncbi:MAG: AraC family transcriptional regulator, partial [Melioribacteraceae bacterium]|nr:AraC family transcriptional regulator [Melioribacteraceae bacterium]
EKSFSIFQHSFSSFDEFEQATKGWDLNIKKLDRGNYRGDLLQIFNEKIIISDVNIGSKLEMNGAPMLGYKSFGVPKINVAPFYWRYNNLSDKTIQIYRPGSELFMINKYEMGAIDVAVEEEHFDKLCSELKYDNVQNIICENEFVTCDFNLLRELQNRLAQLSKMVRKIDPKNHHLLNNEVNYEIPILLIKTLASAYPISNIDKSFARTKALKKVIELIEETPMECPSLAELSSAANVSERTLQYLFKDKYGISPKRFIKTIKLNSIYRALKANSSYDIAINNIANQYGLWHMGQFAKDYKNLFGELPSETIHNK